MSEEKYNWPRFYRLLGEKGIDLLIGVEKNVIDCFIRDQAKETDEFYSFDMEEALSDGASAGDLRVIVPPPLRIKLPVPLSSI